MQVPAYLKSREELEDRAKRHAGALVTDKEAVEVGMDMQDEASKAVDRKKMQESLMDDKQPVLAFDRRLPKNAKNKQHLLSRIHTIESTLQRLYGKLEADSELPDIESIEQIMASTIKQSVYATDTGGAAQRSQLGDTGMSETGSPLRVAVPETPVKPGVSFGDDVGGGADEDEGEGLPLDDAERRTVLRAERRRRMEERERERAERAALELTSGKVGGGGGAGGATVRFGEAEEALAPPDPAAMKARFEDTGDAGDMRMMPRSIPASVQPDDDEPRAGRRSALRGHGDGAAESPAGGGTRRTASPEAEGISQEELQQMAAQDGATAWHSAFSKARHGKRNDLIAMLDAGCPVDLKDEQGNTLLNIGAQNGHKSIIKALLRRGAALNTQNHNGQTPLHFCFTYGFTDLGNYLISKGADDTVQNFGGLTCYEGLGD